jgi:hypothetical protein
MSGLLVKTSRICLILVTQVQDARGSGSYNLVPITTEQLAYYNAVRGTGNNNIFIASTAGSAKFEVFPPAVASQYAGLTNAIWETHYYNFISNFSTDVATNLADLNNIVSNPKLYLSPLAHRRFAYANTEIPQTAPILTQDGWRQSRRLTQIPRL